MTSNRPFWSRVLCQLSYFCRQCAPLIYGGDPTTPQLFHEQNGTWTGIAHTSQNDLGDIISGHIFVVSSTDEWVYSMP